MMSSDHYMECHTLPAINETFSQFNARPSATISAAANLIYSPLDLSLRAGPNIAPITPPTTPSPPRKRHRLMSEENYLWRPHMSARASPSISTSVSASTSTSTTPALLEYTNHYLHGMCYPKREGFYPSTSEDEVCNHSDVPNYLAGEDNFCEIPKSQRSVMMLSTKDNEQEQEEHHHHHHHHQQKQSDISAIYVDDETIILTEDDDDDDADDDGKEEDEDDEEVENETLVSSQEFTDTRDITEESSEFTEIATTTTSSTTTITTSAGTKTLAKFRQELVDDEVKSTVNVEEEEEYVDILSNDDDELNPLALGANTILRLRSQAELEQEQLEKSGKVLTRNKLIYDNEEMHNKAVNGLDKLFSRDFHRITDNNDATEQNVAKEKTKKTYIDLTNCQRSRETHESPQQTVAIEQEKNYYCLPSTIGMGSSGRPSYKTHKTERKRMKLRKQMSLDEETLSPVSGTIIRKLRDDEELVVRKGDIDPAFNVVEVTEEAKAILASIDNKIGAYLCQLCRTLYDDAFKLAQHRCPRIVHIEYKCSECDKVFNCPANLASHRRWHKPKSEMLASSQSKKRLNQNHFSEHITEISQQQKPSTDDIVDGIFPCTQCGKTFRRNAYLKKHQASHQMLDNLKHLDMFKGPRRENPKQTFHQSPQIYGCSAINANQTRANTSALYSSFGPLHASRPYPNRFGALPFSPSFDYRRFYSLGELYLTQQLDRSSAFQYVHANHLRNLNNMANVGNFISRPMANSPLMPLPVK